MKNQIKSLLLVAFVLGTVIPAWGQASTEGKDFWVANTIVCQPPTASSPAFPTIAVSAQKACTVTITDYAGNQLVTANVAAGSWTRFGDNTAAIDPADYYLDPSKWYPSTNNINATDVYNHADKINNYGLHVTATENVSVYVIMGTPQYSMDACNALPITALQSEYYLQDLYPYSKDVSKCVTMTTILATENNTQVVITPKGNTYGKNNNGVPFTISLNKGQTYYLISSVNAQLAGTHIIAKGGKKIAVYVGSPNTHAPGGVSARDALFEQMMPIDYWGTQFIATRSLQKDGNIIGITATQNGTELKIDGFTQATINEGETYYIVLQGPADPYTKNLSKIVSPIDQVITADAAFIETSCPAAVISYDTGNSFKGEDAVTEIVDGQGDPSSVWLSPIQQKINRITFGACYTKKTKAHFLNVVTETATCTNTVLTAYMGQYGSDWSNKLTWIQVPGNPVYSYARVQIGNNTETINVFTLENSKGFIAHVYGNGEDESYAYSAGSAAVKRSVSIVTPDGTPSVFVDETELEITPTFCLGDTLTFRPDVAGNAVSRVIWDFDDGVTKDIARFEEGDTLIAKHVYTSPGWHDAEAILYGEEYCNRPAFLDTVNFRFFIGKADTIPFTIALCADSVATFHFPMVENTRTYAMADLTQDEVIRDTLYSAEACPITYLLTIYAIGKKDSTIDLDTVLSVEERRDGAWIPADGADVLDSEHPTDEWVTRSGTYDRKYHRADTECDSIVHYKVTILKCLDLQVSNNPDDYHTCFGDTLKLPISYDLDGKPGKAYFIHNETDAMPIALHTGTEDDTRMRDTLLLPTETWKPGYYSAFIEMEDVNCDTVQKTPILNLAVYYPQSIFAFKFNNVLAVYTKGSINNPDYDFTAWQWYRNGQAIDGANKSVYHSDTPFVPGDTYYVLLGNEDMTLPSCEFTVPEDIPDYNAKNNAPAATKKLINRHMYIVVEDRMYDAYGQRVQ